MGIYMRSMYACRNVHIYIYVYSIRMHMCVCVRVCVCVCECVCLSVCLSICLSVCLSACLSVCMFVCPIEIEMHLCTSVGPIGTYQPYWGAQAPFSRLSWSISDSWSQKVDPLGGSMIYTKGVLESGIGGSTSWILKVVWLEAHRTFLGTQLHIPKLATVSDTSDILRNDICSYLGPYGRLSWIIRLFLSL